MKSLFDNCLLVICEQINSDASRVNINSIPSAIRSLLLERAIWHDLIADSSFYHSTGFLNGLKVLKLHDSNALLSNDFLSAIVRAKVKLTELRLVVPFGNAKSGKITTQGLAAFLSQQNELERLYFAWNEGFEPGVLCKIRCKSLKSVSLIECNVGDRRRRDYLREVGLLAMNNPGIEFLHLSDLPLDFNDLVTVIHSLRKTLRRLEIKSITLVPLPDENLVNSVELILRTCQNLHYLSFSTICVNVRAVHQLNVPLIITAPDSFRILCLQGYVFRQPIIYQANGIRKLKLCLSGVESVDYVEALQMLPALDKIHITFLPISDPDFTVLNGILTTFGPKITSLVAENALTPDTLTLIVKYATALKTLGIRSHEALCPLFNDSERSGKLKCLRLLNADFTTLSSVARFGRRIKSVDLAYSQAVDDLWLASFAATAGGSLKTADLSKCPLTDRGILELAVSAPHLEELSLFSIKLKPETLLTLTAHCPFLTVLHFDDAEIGPETMKQCKRNVIGRLNLLNF